MKTRVAINGFGRIGRNAFKIAFERADIDIVAINDLTDTKTLAHLLKHDSNYGAYEREVMHDDEHVIVAGQSIRVLAEKDPTQLPWKDLAVDVVIESTGLFTHHEQLEMHLKAGAKRVVLSAPEKDDTHHDTYVLGVNEQDLKPEHTVISNASCTTNCITPVAAVIESNFGIAKAMMTTVHSYTASQRLQDAPAKDLREARNAAENIVPTSTGASIAAAKALPAESRSSTFSRRSRALRTSTRTSPIKRFTSRGRSSAGASITASGKSRSPAGPGSSGSG
jgi:glyceraldehyde 3-phosphate dehydrogenase